MVGVMVTVTVVTSGRDVRARVIWRHSCVAVTPRATFGVRRYLVVVVVEFSCESAAEAPV